MLFNSIEFIIFLPIVFLLYWLAAKSTKLQNFLVVVASYIFYGWWDWRFLILIVFTSLCSFGSGILIERYKENRSLQKIISASNIIINLGILGVFKYFNFFVDNLEILFETIGWHVDWVTSTIILPVGISFYTFQALSYSIDVYQKKIPATHDLIEFCAYISFFPQLVAGPIERATNLLPQFQKSRCFDYSKAVDGCRQMLWGFFKKLVIADNCAFVVNEYWGDYSTMSGISILVLGILFTFQIYCDFSGYSDIAIGCARLFGFNLMRNFHFPYFSRSIPEFWRRWHISLMTWLRDYIYFPLGGSKCRKRKAIRNTYIVWGISGLWHGANWTFVCWGIYHATILTVYKILNLSSKESEMRLVPKMKDVIKMFCTFIFVVIGWIVFRAENVSQAYDILNTMIANCFIRPTDIHGLNFLGFAFILMIIEWFQKEKPHALDFPVNRFFRYRIVRWCTYYIILLLIMKFTGESQTFIYFQF